MSEAGSEYTSQWVCHHIANLPMTPARCQDTTNENVVWICSKGAMHFHSLQEHQRLDGIIAPGITVAMTKLLAVCMIGSQSVRSNGGNEKKVDSTAILN